MKLTPSLVALSVVLAVTAKITGPYGVIIDPVMRSCFDATKLYDFACTTESDMLYVCVCQYTPMVQLLVGCWKDYAKSESHLDYIINKGIEDCRTYGLVEWTSSQLKLLASDSDSYTAAGLPSTVTSLTTPIKLPGSLMRAYIKATKQQNKVFRDGDIYGAAILMFWGVVFGVYAIFHWARRWGVTSVWACRAVTLWRSKVLLPPLGRLHHYQIVGSPLWGLKLPTRMETIVIVLYVLMNLLVNALPYPFDNKNVTMGRTDQVMAYVGDRTGLVSVAHLPLIVLTSGRNSILIWLTGIPYATFITFHKWMARGMFANAFVHSVIFTHMHIRPRLLWLTKTHQAYFMWGIVATSFGGAVLLFALHPFRRMLYDAFRIGHIALGVVFIVGMWRHLEPMGWMGWMYAVVAVWAFDRVVRSVRMFMFGTPMATVTLHGDNTLRIEVPKPHWWAARPGTYAYIKFLTPSLWMQLHPFLSLQPDPLNPELFAVVVQTKQGITEHWRKKIEELSGSSVQVRVTVEGPYGHSSSFHRTTEALFLAGGHGIASVLPLATQAAREGTKLVRLVWAVRQQLYLEWVGPELAQAREAGVQVEVYVTQKESEKQALTAETSKEGSPATMTCSAASSLTVLHGRPDVCAITAYALSEARGAITVALCGPLAMCDAIRATVASTLPMCPHPVVFDEQLQQW